MTHLQPVVGAALLLLSLAACGEEVVEHGDLSQDAAVCSGIDSGQPAALEGPCSAGSCSAGRVCLQHNGGAINDAGSSDTFYCVLVPCECKATPTCECVTKNLGICQRCADPADASGTNIKASGDLLCLGQ